MCTHKILAQEVQTYGSRVNIDEQTDTTENMTNLKTSHERDCMLSKTPSDHPFELILAEFGQKSFNTIDTSGCFDFDQGNLFSLKLEIVQHLPIN